MHVVRHSVQDYALINAISERQCQSLLQTIKQELARIFQDYGDLAEKNA